MHGGAKGSGAPLGNRNALKHGLTTRAELRQRKKENAKWRELNRLVKEMARERSSSKKSSRRK
jgi:hypothetical protein